MVLATIRPRACAVDTFVIFIAIPPSGSCRAGAGPAGISDRA